MKPATFLVLALVCGTRLLAAQESAEVQDSGVIAFHQEDQGIKGTVTVPAGTYVLAAFHAPHLWRNYLLAAIHFSVDPKVPGTATFDLEAAVTPGTGNFVGLASGWKLRKPDEVPGDRYTLVGELSSSVKSGGPTPAPSRAVTLQSVTDARRPAAGPTAVCTWTAAYIDGRPDDTVTLDLWIGRDFAAILAQVPIEDTVLREADFHWIHAHFYGD